MSDRLRSDLQNVENLDGLQHFSQAFYPLAIDMEKIWSFFETKDSTLEVKATSNIADRTGSASIRRLVSNHSEVLYDEVAKDLRLWVINVPK